MYIKNPLLNEGFGKNLMVGMITGNPAAALPFGNLKAKIKTGIAKKLMPNNMKAAASPAAALANK